MKPVISENGRYVLCREPYDDMITLAYKTGTDTDTFILTIDETTSFMRHTLLMSEERADHVIGLLYNTPVVVLDTNTGRISIAQQKTSDLESTVKETLESLIHESE